MAKEIRNTEFIQLNNEELKFIREGHLLPAIRDYRLRIKFSLCDTMAAFYYFGVLGYRPGHLDKVQYVLYPDLV